jgi:hypothetical protein
MAGSRRQRGRWGFGRWARQLRLGPLNDAGDTDRSSELRKPDAMGEGARPTREDMTMQDRHARVSWGRVPTADLEACGGPGTRTMHTRPIGDLHTRS